MKTEHQKHLKKTAVVLLIFIAVNLLAVLSVSRNENAAIRQRLSEHTETALDEFKGVMDGYDRSFRLFVQMMAQEIRNNPDPDQVLTYLKELDPVLLGIEGDTYDGLYMYYQGRYLYSWDTPYSVYEESGYVATERPWYKDAALGRGEVVFTPPYMSYANHYILTTISQMQPDSETVFAYDIKMGEIQELVSSMESYVGEQTIIFDSNGTIIGSTNESYLGGNLYDSVDSAAAAASEADTALNQISPEHASEAAKALDKKDSADAFYLFRQDFEDGFTKLLREENSAVSFHLNGRSYRGFLRPGDGFSFLVMVPTSSLLKGTLGTWLVPILILELLLIYIFGRITRDQKNRELKAAYVELGQTQKRLEIALSVAQRAAAVDELTGMMNYRSFKKALTETISDMEEDESGILIMIDGDHFKLVNDNYGHTVGDEVIKLTAQMIVGRIRTVDLASRLHGDEFAIFIANTDDYSVAKRIMEDINQSLQKEAGKRNMPSISLSSGAVIVRKNDNFTALSKAADAKLYQAKETHNGGFAC